jgi:hypothetical protein
VNHHKPRCSAFHNAAYAKSRKHKIFVSRKTAKIEIRYTIAKPVFKNIMNMLKLESRESEIK